MSLELSKNRSGWRNVGPIWEGVIKNNLREENLGTDVFQNVQFLQELDFQGAAIKTLEPLRYMPQLTNLYMSQVEVKDPRPLRFLSNLKRLEASCAIIYDWRVLEALPNLEVLDISFPRFGKRPKLPKLEKLPKLKELYVNGCQIKDLSKFGDVSHLEIISLNFSRVREKDISHFRIRNRHLRILA